MEFVTGVAVGFLLWPWWGMGIFILLCIVDAVLVENDNAGFGTAMMLIGGAALVWLAGDINPFSYIWYNFGDILKFVFLYFLVGGVWSIGRWYLHLVKVRSELRANNAHLANNETKRPRNSYAKYNQARIYSWIGHWPLSIIGYVFGDFLTNIVKSIFDLLSNLYENMGNKVFSEFDEKN